MIGSRRALARSGAHASGLALALAALLAFSPVVLAGELSRTIDDELAKLGKEAKVSAIVRSITTGETLYSKDAHEPTTPASTMKLATTAAALELLGADFEHETGVYARGSLSKEGTLKGDLVVRGSGDPSISRRFQVEEAPLLGDWAEELAKKVKVIEGDVVADDRAFERAGFHPDWNEAEAQDWYAAEVSALNLNDNCLDVTVEPAGGTVRATAKPETRSIALDVTATLTPQKKEHRVACARDAEGKTIHVSGRIWQKASPFEAKVAVRSPALLFANVLSERLASAGVQVKGKARLVAESEPKTTGTPLLVRRSPLLRTLAVCNKRSQNLYAECLLKTLGKEKGEAGSWEAGSKVVSRFLRDLGVAGSELTIRDGSGLSREDRLSASALATILESVVKGPRGVTFLETLSVAGQDGTLEKRLGDLPSGAVFRGKTGTMKGVSSLAGVLELEHGARGERELIAVAVVINGTRGAALARRAQDETIRATVRDRSTSRAASLPESKR
ncbi:D-alanyl-D-alanine carboxypeptidase/D-alanyl-D-alanine-endopeptidase [bacterium]|nr:D-alanyl-D-alanine carboxypeptidase/D-alanyl-D-alanine-endopeptidase [bacterium]